MKSDIHQTSWIPQDWSADPSKNVGEQAHARTHAHQAQMFMQFWHLFFTFSEHFFKFWSFSLLKRKKLTPHLKKDMNKLQFFYFIMFFQFSKEVHQNGRKVPKNWKIPLFLSMVNKIWHLMHVLVCAHDLRLVTCTTCVWAEGPHTRTPHRG